MQNSPANRVPSHGTRRFATAFAIDFVPVNDAGRSGAISARTFVTREPPERFLGFGRAVLAPIAGEVIAAHDGATDHAAHRGIASIAYALTQARRVSAGWAALAGNHVMIAVAPTAIVALCHLRCGSIRVARGETVAPGEKIGECGNSGNSTEPHLHLQAMDAVDPVSARPLPISFARGLPANGTIVTGRSSAA